MPDNVSTATASGQPVLRLLRRGGVFLVIVPVLPNIYFRSSGISDPLRFGRGNTTLV